MNGDNNADGTDDADVQPSGDKSVRRAKRADVHRRQLKTLAGRIWRLELALSELEALQERVRRRLRHLLMYRSRLERSQSASIGAGRGRGHAPSQPPKFGARTAADPDRNWQPLASSRQPRVRHRVNIYLADDQARGLLSSGILTPAEIGDDDKIGAVVQVLVDHWCRQLGCAPDTSEDVDTPPSERRTGADRRLAGPRANSLLSRIAGTVFDRRVSGDRRGTDRAGKSPSILGNDFTLKDRSTDDMSGAAIRNRVRGIRRRERSPRAQTQRPDSPVEAGSVVVLWPGKDERARRETRRQAAHGGRSK